MEQHGPLTWWKEGKKKKYSDENGVTHDVTEEHWREGDKMFHLCPDGRVYKWRPRKESPLSCPRCRYRFDSPYSRSI